MGANLVVLCDGREVIVQIEGGARLATLPVSRLKGRPNAKAERVAELLGDLEEAETQAKSAAARAARKGFSYQAIYSSSKSSLMRSHNWPREAVQWAEGVLAQAVRIEASRAGRARQ